MTHPSHVATHTLVALALAVGLAFAAPPSSGDAPGAGPLDRLKRLEGQWEGKAGAGGTPSDVKVSYRVTAGGNAVTETLFEGTPHEMMTVYYVKDGAPALTHYCASGRHPRMKWNAKSTANEWILDFDGPANAFDPKKDFHMHDARIFFDGEDHVRSEWQSHDHGKPSHVAVFDLHRVK